MKQYLSNIVKSCTKNSTKCAIAVSLMGLVSGGAMAQSYWTYGSQAKPNFNKAYFPTQKCINMGGGLEAPKEGEWGYTFERKHFAAIKAQGFDTVRIPIKWSAHIDNKAPYTIDPVFLKRVDQIISWGLEHKLNVIINVHHFSELLTNPDENEVKLLAIWEQLGYHYATAPKNLFFEIINEPDDKFSGNRVNLIQNQALALIRRNNPYRTVILSGDKMGDLKGIYNLRLPNDPYVVASVHYYHPADFTHQGAEWLGENAPPLGRDWPKEGEMDILNKEISIMYDWRKNLGAPIFLGEYGTETALPQAWRVKWGDIVTKGMRKAQIPTCYFNFAYGFGIYDTKTDEWNREILEAIK